MSICASLFLSIFCLILSSPAQAEVGIYFSQSSHFWGAVGDVFNGVKDISVANELLNETYGHPEGDQLTLSFEDRLISSGFKLKEFKAEQIAYAFATNPVLPTLFAWVGAGPSATFAYQNVDLFGGYYWGKYVNAASTDLIDRPLLQADQVPYVGLGLNYITNWGDVEALPMHFEFHSRHGYFSSSILGSEWINRINSELDISLSQSLSIQFLAGAHPNPDYRTQSLLWDYLWKNDLNAELLNYLGVGIDFAPIPDANLHFIAGYYGGYMGGAATYQGSLVSMSLFTYGYETSSAFQGRQLRLFGGSFSWYPPTL